MDDDPVFGRLVPTNLTSGKGGVGGAYTDVDFVRAIRHGIGKDGRALIVMPSEFFNKFSDEDLGAIVAYLKSAPPVDNELPATRLGPLGRVITLVEGGLLPATIIDHDAPRPVPPTVGVNREYGEYGEYIAVVCSACHGEDLSGGPLPGAEPGDPVAANITVLARSGWNEDNFKSFLRTGTTHYGKQVDNEYMPWKSFARMTDDEIDALWLFMASLTPVTQ